MSASVAASAGASPTSDRIAPSPNTVESETDATPLPDKTFRPPAPSATPAANKGDEQPQPGATVCHNCLTTTTPLWRRDENGQILCNACGLFLKLHGRRRPISLKTDVIKSRNRSRNSGPTKRQSNAKRARLSNSPSVVPHSSPRYDASNGDGPVELLYLKERPETATNKRSPIPSGSMAPLPKAPGQPKNTSASSTYPGSPSLSPFKTFPTYSNRLSQGPGQHLPMTTVGATPAATPPHVSALASHHTLPPMVATPRTADTSTHTAGASRQSESSVSGSPEPFKQQPQSATAADPAPPRNGMLPAIVSSNQPLAAPGSSHALPGISTLPVMNQPASPQFAPQQMAAKSPPDVRLIRGHMSEQLLPHSPPGGLERIPPLTHILPEEAQGARATANMTQGELLTKVSELELVNDLLQRRIGDLEYSENQARRAAMEAQQTAENLWKQLNSLRQGH